jgi:hypothetical protein
VLRKALVVLAALVVLWLTACAFLFLWPREDSVSHADAIVVLAGDATHRIPPGVALFRRGVAPNLVLSRDTGPGWDRRSGLCGRRRVVCFRAKPFSTQGEAETVARIARRRGWRSLVVVSSRYHVFRARMLFRRCVKGRVDAVGTGYDRRWLPLILPLESAKLLRALTTERGC